MNAAPDETTTAGYYTFRSEYRRKYKNEKPIYFSQA